jgi:hypothetical protein
LNSTWYAPFAFAAHAAGAEVIVKLYGVAAYKPSMEAGILAAAVKALGFSNTTSYPLGCVQVQQVVTSMALSSRAGKRLLGEEPATRQQLSAASSEAHSTVHIQALSNVSTVIKLKFHPSDNVTNETLQTAVAPTGPFLAFFRNALPPEVFPTSGGAVQQCSNSTTCDGLTLVVITPIKTCKVDVCFAIDGSGSILDGQWQVEINVVDSIIGAIGGFTRRLHA